MPTYEYECRECSHSFEAFQAMSDEPLKTCPECGKEIRRLIFGGTGVIFKGSGFYVTDKNKGRNAAIKPKGESKTESSSSGGGAAASGDKAGSCGAQCPAASAGAGCPAAASGGDGAKAKAAATA